jgi:hypothetical protein
MFHSPVGQGGAHVFRRRCQPAFHGLADQAQIDAADKLFDRTDRGRRNGQPPDAQAQERQGLEPPPAHFAADPDVDVVVLQRAQDPAQETQDSRAEPVIALRQLGIGTVRSEEELREVVGADRKEGDLGRQQIEAALSSGT